MEADNFSHLHHYIHRSLSSCWIDLMPAVGIYDPSRSKASALTPALRYFAHTLTERRESTGVVNTHDISPQGIQSMLHMPMIERRRGFDPPQYLLARAIDEDDTEDILDDIPAFQEDLPSRPPPSHRIVHAAASLSKVFDHLHRFEQYRTQQFDSIETTLQQIFQHFHILPPAPPPHDLAVNVDF
ncbi:hypothetical protein PVK06_026378 [Gossypium arboreum]|uniref:Uncharacterized protein n=1 Tax=Gossypium arboreum TaxID=29729 RepID=A0ABR0P0D4_GOSAR|nr:hypothetical protein PVK06_026378 [Gossypium arboreum]